MPLTDFAIKNAKGYGKPRKLSDFDGLYLYISPRESRLWRMDYRYAGKRKTASFGAYPKVSLAEARERRDAARKLLKDGHDPIIAKHADKARNNGNSGDSFETLARGWFENRKARWAPTHAASLMNRLETYVFPDLGSRPIGDIDPPELLTVLRQVERRPAPSTAKKVLQTCGQIFRFAIAEGHAKRDPSRDLEGALTAGPPVKHRAALTATELPTFFARLDAHSGSEHVRLALELMLLCMTRTSETCQARWTEFEALDGKSPLWRVPAYA